MRTVHNSTPPPQDYKIVLPLKLAHNSTNDGKIVSSSDVSVYK